MGNVRFRMKRRALAFALAIAVSVAVPIATLPQAAQAGSPTAAQDSSPTAEEAPALRPTHGPATTSQSHPAARAPSKALQLRLRPSHTIIFSARDKADTLERVQIALTQVADGANYVWRHSTSGLGGVIRPVRSYRGRDGAICRDFEILLIAYDRKRRTLASACRNPDRVWHLRPAAGKRASQGPSQRS